MHKQALIEKINNLPPERTAEVEDFVDFITERDEHRLLQTVMKMSEDSFHRVWENDEDSAYDCL